MLHSPTFDLIFKNKLRGMGNINLALGNRVLLGSYTCPVNGSILHFARILRYFGVSLQREYSRGCDFNIILTYPDLL